MLRLLLLTVLWSGVMLMSSMTAANEFQVPMRITGTFLDVAYDPRLTYTNAVGHNLSCAEWQLKIFQMYNFGIRKIIFQAVHDDRWGAYYNSSLSFMKPWTGRCPDVVKAVMEAADALEDLKIFLSCEYYKNEFDTVTNPAAMKGRLEIMSELVQKGYAARPSFEGWYFSSEAYITPYFQESFFTYVETLKNLSDALTPDAKVFISPYGTRYAVNDDKFVAQLKRLPVDFVAYQDEVGCVRDEWPEVQADAAFRTLAAAHARAGRSTLWANVESFTWQDWPNNDTSPLIPAEWQRIAAQVTHRSMVPGIERVITFTAQGLYEEPRALHPWGGPNNTDLFRHYESLFSAHAATAYKVCRTEVMALSQSYRGQMNHSALGATAEVKVAGLSAPAAPYNVASLTDGSFGSLTTNDTAQWLGFNLSALLLQGSPRASSAEALVEVNITFPSDAPLNDTIHFLGLRLLKVSKRHFVDGAGLQPVERRIFSLTESTAPLFLIVETVSQGFVSLQFPPEEKLFQTRYDVYADFTVKACLSEEQQQRLSSGVRSVQLSFSVQLEASSVSTQSQFLFVDELVVNPHWL
jgi:hypothetical protein